MSNRLDQEREERLEPVRYEKAIKELEDLGFHVNRVDRTKIQFLYKEWWVTYYPYSGWATGQTIEDGRGLRNLLKQLDNK